MKSGNTNCTGGNDGHELKADESGCRMTYNSDKLRERIVELKSEIDYVEDEIWDLEEKKSEIVSELEDLEYEYKTHSVPVKDIKTYEAPRIRGWRMSKDDHIELPLMEFLDMVNWVEEPVFEEEKTKSEYGKMVDKLVDIVKEMQRIYDAPGGTKKW